MHPCPLRDFQMPEKAPRGGFNYQFIKNAENFLFNETAIRHYRLWGCYSGGAKPGSVRNF
jgi:hypothetical protein